MLESARASSVGRGGLGVAQLAFEDGSHFSCMRRVGRCDGDKNANAGSDKRKGDRCDVHTHNGGGCLSDALLCVAIVVVDGACNGEREVDEIR